MIKKIVILTAICAIVGYLIAFHVAKTSPANIYACWWAIGAWITLFVIRVCMPTKIDPNDPDEPSSEAKKEVFAGFISLAILIVFTFVSYIIQAVWPV